jgi:hypothetical protein
MGEIVSAEFEKQPNPFLQADLPFSSAFPHHTDGSFWY